MAEEEKAEKPQNQTSSLVFGTDRQVVVSEAQANFNEKEISFADRAAAHANANYLKGKHWELGHDNFGEIQSTMRRDFGYKKASSKERAAAEILKKDLTTEHYHLGFNDDPARYQSCYHADMGPASLYSDQPNSHEKFTKPPTSITLGTDANTILSTSQAAYVKPSLKDTHFVDGKARSAMLRVSNVLMGNDRPEWQTASSKAFVPLHGKPADPIIKKTDVNVTFGTDNPKYISEQQMKYSDVDALHKACRERETLDPTEKADLRASHFVFGTDNNQRYQSCSQAAFGEKEISTSLRNEQLRIKNAMKSVYMTLGNDRPVLTSNSRAAFVPPPQEQLREAALGEVRDERKRIMQKASYTLGTDGKAEQAARFQSLQSEDMRLGLAGVDYAQLAGLSEDVKADLRKHHFSFGIDPRTAKTTSQAAYVTPPAGSGPGAMDAAVKADLRTHHFNFGNDNYKQGISTTTQDQMVYHGYVAAALDPELKADLRAVHYVMGRDPIPKRSTYGDAFQYPIVKKK